MTSARSSSGFAKRGFEPWADRNLQPLLRIEVVSKRFGEFLAVNQLSLEVYQGASFALLGPSGCRKTTLLRLVAGFEQPSTGRILLEGVDLAPVPPHRRPVNLMFQSYALFPHLTVEGNIAFGLKQEGLPKAEIASRVDEMLALVRLEGFAKRKPQHLSGGQRQRVALARSLIKRPRVLLLDEPLAALDKKLRSETQFELMQLQESLGLTFVIVTHDQQEAMTVAGRIAVMDHGRLVQVATPQEIYERPTSRWVADFIGEINLIEGSVIEMGRSGSVVASAAGRLRALSPADVTAGDVVWVALRPEKVRIALEPPPVEGENCVAGQVADIGYLGDLSIYKVRLDNGIIMKTAVANVTRLVERPINWDDRVWLTWCSEPAMVLMR